MAISIANLVTMVMGYLHIHKFSVGQKDSQQELLVEALSTGWPDGGTNNSTRVLVVIIQAIIHKDLCNRADHVGLQHMGVTTLFDSWVA